jgi:ATP-binding protein involved in chromosome partitioning
VPGIRNIIAVGAGKGGVGKSTTAVNLAVALQRKGARVGLMDADVYGPNTPQMLGIDQGPEVSEAKRMIPPEAFGVKVISMGMLVPADQPIIWRGPMLHGAVQQFMRDVGGANRLPDRGPAAGHGRRFPQHGPERPRRGAVVVTTRKGRVRLGRAQGGRDIPAAQHPVLGVVENMSFFVCDHCRERTIFGHGGRGDGEELSSDAGPDPDRHARARAATKGGQS